MELSLPTEIVVHILSYILPAEDDHNVGIYDSDDDGPPPLENVEEEEFLQTRITRLSPPL